MFADSENVETDLVGVFDLFEQIVHAGARAEGDTCRGVWKYRCEAVNTDLHKCNQYADELPAPFDGCLFSSVQDTLKSLLRTMGCNPTRTGIGTWILVSLTFMPHALRRKKAYWLIVRTGTRSSGSEPHRHCRRRK